MDFDGFILFSISLLALIIAQRLLQRELQIILLLITRRPNLAIGIFSIILLPGVFIHEISHLLMAILLGVPVKKISLLPEVSKQGRIRLGFVQTSKTDVIRDSLIGLAPFILGLIIVGFIGAAKLGLPDLIQPIYAGYFNAFFSKIINLRNVTDFGLWIYLAFAISTTMIPSESDRQSWKVILLGLLIILLIVLISGIGNWMLNTLYVGFNTWLISISIILVGSVLVHLFIYVPAWIIRQILLKFSGMRLA